MMQMMGMNYGNKDGRKETFECSDHPTWREAARMGGFQTSMILNRTSGDDPPSFAGDYLILMFSTVSVFSTKPAACVLQGFSGCLIVEHLDALVQGVLKPFTWALAGRSLPKLEKMASQCRSRPKVSVDDCPLLGDEVSHESEAWFRKMDEKWSKWLRLDFHLFM